MPIRPRSTATGSTSLDDERRSHFFSWFCLEPTRAPELEGDGRSCHRFRPAGSEFRDLVEVAILVDTLGRPVVRQLWISRAFIDHPRNGAFARDIAKSFLEWALPSPMPNDIGVLVRHIADFSAARAPVIVRAGTQLRPSVPDATAGYDVFLDRRPQVEISAGGARLKLANLAASAGPVPCVVTEPATQAARWLTIVVDAEVGPAGVIRRAVSPFRRLHRAAAGLFRLRKQIE